MYNNKSKEKQVKETVPTQSQSWLFPATLVSPAACGRLNPPIQQATTHSKHSEFVAPVKLWASQEMEMLKKCSQTCLLSLLLQSLKLFLM